MVIEEIGHYIDAIYRKFRIDVSNKDYKVYMGG
jgi:hypothetical protein